MDVGTPWDALPSNPNRTQDLARMLMGGGPNVGGSLPRINSAPIPRLGPYEGTGAAPNAHLMGSRASFDPPVADLQFGAPLSPQMDSALNAAPSPSAVAGMRDMQEHNDQPVNRTFGEFAGRPDMGEAGADPFGRWDTEQAIGRFAPKPTPNMQQLMQLLAAGQGTEA